MKITSLSSWTKDAVIEFQTLIKQWVYSIMPQNTSDLKNDSGYITASEVPSREVVHDETMTGDGTSEDSALSVNTMSGATSDKDGTAGLVPAPGAEDVSKYLRGDGSWVTPPPSSTYAYDEESETLTITVN